MIVDVEVPNQGLTITEATLLLWLKQPGDAVVKGDILFEIETDKATQEIESPISGTLLQVLAQAGDVVPLGQIVAKIGTEAGDEVGAGEARDDSRDESDIRNARDRGESAAPNVVVEQAKDIEGGRRMVSPRARRAARRLGVDLTSVQPTGAHGRHVRERDVLLAAEENAGASAARVSGRYRAKTAEQTALSFRDTPHFYLTREVRADRLAALRADMVRDTEAETGVRISITDFLLKALALALRAFPSVNSQRRNDTVALLSAVNIGLAVDTAEGLAAPILQSVDTQSLTAIARARIEAARRAAEGTLRNSDIVGGSFTLTNLGPLGVDQFDAIIVPPQSGILAAGAIKMRPHVIDGEVRACNTLFLTLAMDHRVVDGAEAARFLDFLANLIEKPTLLCSQ